MPPVTRPRQRGKLRRRPLALFAVLLVLLTVVWFLLHPPMGLLSAAVGRACPGAVYGVETQQKLVALTIDDAPNFQPETTRPILDLLAQYQVQATFFIITDKIKAPLNSAGAKNALMLQLVQAGHELGNHLTRDEPSINLGAKFATEVDAAQTELNRYAPQYWLRPGGGWCNSEMVSIAKQKGYQVALGSIWPYDTMLNNPGFSVWYALQNLSPGAIIILHDSGPQGAWGKNTHQALSQLLPILKQKGYQVVTLSQLSQAGQPLKSGTARSVSALAK
jgi:peptidoglycan-N-acetylglucosamine deacetylase